MGYPVWTIAYAAIAGFAAGYVKGYSGFAFSMLMVLSLSAVFPPALVIPPILILETLANLWLLPRAWREAHWPSLRWLFLGLALGTPLGVILLAQIPAGPMRGAIAVIVLAIVLVLKRGFRLQAVPGTGASTGLGVFSGVLNGGAAIGGMPVSVYYFSSPLAAAVGRASLIVYLFFAGIWTTGMAAWQGLVGVETFKAAGVLMIPVLAGILLGMKVFSGSNDESFRATVLNILIGLSLAGLLRAIVWG